MRAGTVYQRCTKCGGNTAPDNCGDCRGKIVDRACTGCGKVPRHYQGCPGTKATWALSVAVHPPGGKRKLVVRSGFKTKRAALDALHELQGEVKRGERVEPSKITVGDYLDLWLEGGGRLTGQGATVSPGTHDSRKLHVTYLKPLLGDVPLQALDKLLIQSAYAKLAASGRVYEGGSKGPGLSAKTVFNIHTTLSRAMEDAVAAHYLRANPAKGACKRPAHVPVPHWNPDVLGAFYAWCAKTGDRWTVAWRLAGAAGLRRGELIGASWADVDFEAPHITLRQQRAKGGGTVQSGTLKGKRGRTVGLDPTTVEMLRAWRKQQVEERLAWGPSYVDSGLIVTAPDGSPVYPDTPTKTFRGRVVEFQVWHSKRFVDQPTPPTVTLHGLRHSHAAALLRAGEHMRVIQERFGHSSWQVTGDVYSHLDPGANRRAADNAAALVDGVHVPEPVEGTDDGGSVAVIGGRQ